MENLGNYENPFVRQGTDDPFQNQEQKPIVNVGLVNKVAKLIFGNQVGVNPQVCHVMVIASYGGGKSATLRNIYNKAELNKKATAYVKLENNKFKEVLKVIKEPATNYCATLIMDIAQQLFKKDAKFKGRKGSEHPLVVDAEYRKFMKSMNDRPISTLFKELAGTIDSTPGAVLIDEIEVMLVNDEVPLQVRLDVLDIFKNWSETTKTGLSLILAGTQPCLDFIRVRAPKLLGGRFIICDSYNLDYDEVEQYIIEKCQAATSAHIASDKIFSKDARQLIFHASSGIPRRIEMIAHDAWQTAAFKQRQVDRTMVRERLYAFGDGTLTHVLHDCKLTVLEQKALRKLLRHGMNTIDAKTKLTASEKEAIRRIARRPYNSPIITKRGYGWYEFSDQLIVKMFSRNLG